MREWFIEQLAMYSAYHRDRRNQATHHVGVPLIVYALLVALLGFYLLNVPLVGAIATVIYGILYTLAVKVGAEDIGFVWTTFAVCFIGGWAIQFIGHVFEGRRPALFDNAVQVFMAPPFLIAEMLFAAGLEQGLARDIARRQTRYARG
jgi:uncharacterized membrane protein YGL010W